MKSCAVCGAIDPTSFYSDLKVFRCRVCGLVYADVSIDPRRIYTRGYYQAREVAKATDNEQHAGPHSSRRLEYPDYEREKRALQCNFRKRLGMLRRLLPEGRRLFEIGSAYGYFLELASKEYLASGIEISEHAAKYARERVGVEVTCGDFLDLPDSVSPKFDIVCLWDVLEHLSRPDAHLAKVHHWLRPGGLVAFTTGDISSLLPRLRGRRWRLMCPPWHLYYFSPRTIGHLLQRTGFSLVYLSHLPVYRTYASAVGFSIHASWLRWLLTIGSRLDFIFPFNAFDIMFVVAKNHCEEHA